jgi:hypothetical protein
MAATLTIELPEARLERLLTLAHQAGVSPEALVQANLEVWLSQLPEDFSQAAQYVLQKNQELYRRLA